jgi:hypothetical protein
MKRTLTLAIASLLAMTPAVGAWQLFACCNRGIHCMEPVTYCPDCSEPEGHHHCWAWRSEQAQKLICEVHQASCCCDRIKAVEKLGSCLHADYHCDPEVLPTLVEALQCDTCWEVRKAAAWSITCQNARTKYAVMALYLAGKLDPHYMVRDAARDALDVLIVCHRECYKDLFESVDKEAAKIKPYYKPTSGQCVHIVESGCGFVVHVCEKKEEKKAAKKEEVCLVPITIEKHECPAGCPTGTCPGRTPLPGLVPPPGAVVPERIHTLPAPGTRPEAK